jgi:putative tricarboxylic transport membrane protein
MRNASLRKLTVGTVAAGLVLTGCGTTAEGGSASDSGGGRPDQRPPPHDPNSPGSGYDTTGREVAKVLEARSSPSRSRSSTSRAPVAPSACSAS